MKRFPMGAIPAVSTSSGAAAGFRNKRMKLIIVLLSVPLFAQLPPAPTCAHTLRWTPQGAIQAFRNGILLDDADVAVAGRQIAPVRFADQDKMTYIYIREVDPPPPAPAHYSAPNKEIQLCTGDQNPPPKPVAIARFQCHGSGPADPAVPSSLPWDCSGMELFRFTLPSGAVEYFAAISDPPIGSSIGPCPTTPTSPCWQPVPLTADPIGPPAIPLPGN
jgi:hypothetical protein